MKLNIKLREQFFKEAFLAPNVFIAFFSQLFFG